MYLRKSRAEEGTNTEEILRRHRETLYEYAAREGIRVTEVFQEIKSGESLSTRPEMLRLLEGVEAGQFGAVLCMDIDRLSRGETRERGVIWAAFKSSGTLIATPGKVYDLSEESDELMTELRGLFANYELRRIKERTRRGMIRAAKEGCHLSYAPYGYRGRVIGKKHTLEIYEPEARFVRMAFEWYAGGAGCGKIAGYLTEAGAHPRRADVFTRVTVLKMIKNPVYTGKVVYNREKWTRKAGKLHVEIRPETEWIVADGLHPAIVDGETFERCQAILAGRYRPPSFDGSVKTSLAGLIRCGNCGGHMQRMNHAGKAYLHCLKRGCCMASRYDLVEERTIQVLEDVLGGLEVAPDTRAEVMAREAERRLVTFRATLEAVKRKKARLYELLEDGSYSKEVFRERMGALENQITVLERRTADAEAEQGAVLHENTPAQAGEVLNALEAYRSTAAPERNALLRNIVDVIWYRRAKGAKMSEFSLCVQLRREC